MRVATPVGTRPSPGSESRAFTAWHVACEKAGLNPIQPMKLPILLLTVGFFLAAASGQLSAQTGTAPAAHTKLVAIVAPVGDSKVRGSVIFEKKADGIHVTARIGGLTPGAEHGFHIHEFGDLGSDDATSAGGHFNPDNKPHGKPGSDERHAGDLGNLKADANGNANFSLVVSNFTLDGGKKGILGRAVIVHSGADDGGQPTGNAGDRIGAGIIGVSKDSGKTPENEEEDQEEP